MKLSRQAIFLFGLILLASAFGQDNGGDKTAAGKPEGEKPETGKPEVEKPETGKPEGEKPETEKPKEEKPKGGRFDKVQCNSESTVKKGRYMCCKVCSDVTTVGGNAFACKTLKEAMKIFKQAKKDGKSLYNEEEKCCSPVNDDEQNKPAFMCSMSATDKKGKVMCGIKEDGTSLNCLFRNNSDGKKKGGKGGKMMIGKFMRKMKKFMGRGNGKDKDSEDKDDDKKGGKGDKKGVRGRGKGGDRKGKGDDKKKGGRRGGDRKGKGDDEEKGGKRGGGKKGGDDDDKKGRKGGAGRRKDNRRKGNRG